MGILGTFKDSVTLVNRTDRNLNVRYDGEDITLKPGENAGFPAVAVPYARKQNPLMGSGHPINPGLYISMVGVKAANGQPQRDDISPIDSETLKHADTKLEVVDRDGELYGEPMRKVALLRKKPFNPYEAKVSLSPDFDVNPNIS